MKSNKKTIVLAVVILLLVLGVTLGASYAYFATANKTTGNDQNLNIVTEDLGSIKWTGTKVFESGDLLPGECGIQTFTIDKNSASGKGIYEIDLKGIIDAAFNEDVEITLYKSVDTTTNNVTIKEGSSTISGDTTKQYYKEDSVVVSGTPEKVYGTKALQNKDQIILEQADFDNSNLQKTTYYLVYCYKNADYSQDAQQGKSFSGEINVRLILQKGGQQESVNAVQYITTLAQTDTNNLATDDYENTRYIGASPNNYVSVDGELWRIIGVMKDIDDGTGKTSARIKLIRNESIGEYSWFSSRSTTNAGYGINEWSKADLMKLLNSDYESNSTYGSLYWNSLAGTCTNGLDNSKKSCDFTSTGIKDKLKTLIGDAVWNIGSQGSNTSRLASNFYSYERSSNIGKICSSGTYCNDTVARTTKWTGKIGLIYPSDYGYATSGGDTTNRTTCLNTSLVSWKNYSDCYSNNWIFMNSNEWTLMPLSDSSYATSVFRICLTGYVGAYYASTSNAVRPSVYLLSSVKIVSGDGSETNPFELSL